MEWAVQKVFHYYGGKTHTRVLSDSIGSNHDAVQAERSRLETQASKREYILSSGEYSPPSYRVLRLR